MPDQITQTVLVDFQADFTDIESAIETLVRTGKVDKQIGDQFKRTTQDIKNQQVAINNTSKAMQDGLKKEVVSIEQVRAEIEVFITEFITGFQEGVIDALKEAGFEFDEFGKIVQKGGETVKKETTGLKAELREIVAELAAMKDRGEDSGAEFARLAKRAGEIKDAIGDANQEVKNFASDTRNIEGVISLAGGITAGFGLASSVTALFGDENEALNETLLRVNASMAALQSLQQLQTLFQKESAASLLIINTQQKIMNAQLALENALQSQSIIVRTGAAVAQRALNFAMAANPIGIVVVALAGLIALLATYGKSAAEARRQTTDLNVALGNNAELFKEREDAIRTLSEARINNLEREGALQSAVLKQELETNSALINARKERLAELQALQKETTDADLKERQRLSSEIRRLQNLQTEDNTINMHLEADLRTQLRKEELQGIANLAQARLAAARKNTAEEFQLQKEAARAQAAVELNEAGQNIQEQVRIRAELNRRIREIDLEAARVRQQDRISALETDLIVAAAASRRINERTSQEEIDLQKRLIQERARLELLQEGLTQNERLRIQRQALQDQADLQRDFNKQTQRETLEDFISANNAQLAQVELSNAERLRLTEENIIAQAEIELAVNQGLAERIKEINAKRDADIRAARLASIQETLTYELALEEARNGTLRRANERIISSDRSTFRQRLNSINQLAVLDIEAINKRQDALEAQLAKGLISQQDYLLQYEQLKDAELAITERTEQQKADLIRQHTLAVIGTTIQLAQQATDIIKQFGDNAIEEQQQKIDTAKQQIEDLRETGAITEKEAERRQKRLEVEERRLRRQQAQREKDFATFKAVLAIPQAFLTGLTQGGPILAAIYAGLAAAQAIAIASRSVPKFGGGKNNSYEGPAEIGETGPELWQTNDRMYYVKKRSFVWVSKNDKVFNPAQTRRMLDAPSMRVDGALMAAAGGSSSGIAIDYDKIGSAVARNIPQIGFNFDEQGFTMYQKGKTSFDKYIDKRRSYSN